MNYNCGYSRKHFLYVFVCVVGLAGEGNGIRICFGTVKESWT